MSIGIFFEKVGFNPDYHPFPPRRPFDERGGLIPFGRFLVGLIFPLIFRWDDIWTHPDHLVEPWFWVMVICNYTGWIVGIASVRYRGLKKKLETPIETNLTVDENEEA